MILFWVSVLELLYNRMVFSEKKAFKKFYFERIVISDVHNTDTLMMIMA